MNTVVVYRPYTWRVLWEDAKTYLKVALLVLIGTFAYVGTTDYMMMREQVVSLKAKAEERDNVIKLQQQQIEELSTVLAKTSNELVTAELKVQEYRSDLQDMTKAYQDHLDAESKTIYNTVVRKLREQKDWVVHKFSQ